MLDAFTATKNFVSIKPIEQETILGGQAEHVEFIFIVIELYGALAEGTSGSLRETLSVESSTLHNVVVRGALGGGHGLG